MPCSDEGIGIAPAELEGILQPFRGGFARGTGLGLSIVHRIVSDYGGELQVTSQPGEGTTVTVKLPLDAAAARRTLGGRSREQAAALEDAVRGARKLQRARRSGKLDSWTAS